MNEGPGNRNPVTGNEKASRFNGRLLSKKIRRVVSFVQDIGFTEEMLPGCLWVVFSRIIGTVNNAKGRVKTYMRLSGQITTLIVLIEPDWSFTDTDTKQVIKWYRASDIGSVHMLAFPRILKN
jgi:hypothetical protein